MRVILNADDFGLSDETVRATIECFEAGALTSATIMPTMPATAAAIEYAKANPRFSFGVHLTYVCDTTEHPVSDPKDVSAICDASTGRFLPSQRVRLLAVRNKIPAEQIIRETSSQIALLRDQGVPVSHVDSHGHLHKFGPFLAALREVLPRFGLRKVRIAQDVYLRKPIKSPTFWYGPIWRRRILREFIGTEHMFMATSEADAANMNAVLAKVSGESLEVGVHPGYEESWRLAELNAAKSFAAAAKAVGHQLINWNEL